MAEEVVIEREIKKKEETRYVFGERELSGNEFVVMGKAMTIKDKKTKEDKEIVKGLWIRKENFAQLAPSIVEIVKKYAPEALQ